MNCRSAQQLISPYLDQQLTGTEMLAMQQHLKKCPACAEEYQQVREVRRLLRSLSPIAPDRPLETQITQRLVAGAGAGWGFGAGTRALSGLPEALSRPQRGQRLVEALALSCLALLMLAAPFAPATSDAARAGGAVPPGVMEADLAQGGVLPPPPAFVRLGGITGAGHSLLGAMGETPSAWNTPQRPGRAFSQGNASVTLSGWSAEPLGDEAVGGYAAGDTALTDAGGR